MKNKRVKIVVLALALTALACTCGPLAQVQGIQATVQSAQEDLQDAATQIGPTLEAAASQAGPTLEAAASQAGPTLQAAQTAAAGAAAEAATAAAEGVEGDGQDQGDSEVFAQWAVRATASSQYGDPDWAAQQATGIPDTHPECGDIETAWASASSNEVATLTLTYETPVTPTQISIFQTLNPGAISEVTVTSVDGQTTTVYTADPSPREECPFVLDIAVSGVQAKVDQVSVTIDQGDHNGWNEIDAVQLHGTP